MTMDQKQQHAKITDAPAWMWGIALVGLVLVTASIGFMLYEAIAGDSSHANVSVYVDSTLPTTNGYLVKFRAVNAGGSTVEGLTIEGTLRDGSAVMEISDTVLEWLPAHSEREGGLFFTSDPRQYQLQLRAKGYENP